MCVSKAKWITNLRAAAKYKKQVHEFNIYSSQHRMYYLHNQLTAYYTKQGTVCFEVTAHKVMLKVPLVLRLLRNKNACMWTFLQHL